MEKHGVDIKFDSPKQRDLLFRLLDERGYVGRDTGRKACDIDCVLSSGYITTHTNRRVSFGLSPFGRRIIVPFWAYIREHLHFRDGVVTELLTSTEQAMLELALDALEKKLADAEELVRQAREELSSMK